MRVSESDHSRLIGSAKAPNKFRSKKFKRLIANKIANANPARPSPRSRSKKPSNQSRQVYPKPIPPNRISIRRDAFRIRWVPHAPYSRVGSLTFPHLPSLQSEISNLKFE